jgi:hypothetical protein
MFVIDDFSVSNTCVSWCLTNMSPLCFRLLVNVLHSHNAVRQEEKLLLRKYCVRSVIC